MDKFSRKVKLSDINYNLYELEKSQKTLNIVESGIVSHDLAMRDFIKNTIEALNSIKVLLENIIEEK